VVGTGAAGRYHCVTGGTPSAGDVSVVIVVRKDRWGFYDQHVNLDEVVAWDLETLARHRRTVQALMRSGWLVASDVPALAALFESEPRRCFRDRAGEEWCYFTGEECEQERAALAAREHRPQPASRCRPEW
jgi:hypothetical protein